MAQREDVDGQRLIGDVEDKKVMRRMAKWHTVPGVRDCQPYGDVDHLLRRMRQMVPVAGERRLLTR